MQAYNNVLNVQRDHVYYALSHHNIQERFQFFLRRSSRIQAERVAGSQVEGNERVRMRLQIDCEDFLRHVVVFQSMVTQRDVDIQSQEFSKAKKAEITSRPGQNNPRKCSCAVHHRQDINFVIISKSLEHWSSITLVKSAGRGRELGLGQNKSSETRQGES